jgi:hypothetical protein
LVRRIVQQVALALSAVATIVITAQHMHPVYAGQAPGLRQLLSETPWRDSAATRSPWASQAQATITTAMDAAFDREARIQADQQAFKADLIRTGQVSDQRADSLATFAVREAYDNDVPPVLVFGVMMTENAQLKSGARSNVGAIGLMQVYPKAWSNLKKRFGSDLNDDETNLRYGVYILSHFLHRTTDSADDVREVADGLRAGLLRYNGCVRGTNTKNCHRYPDVVQSRVERMALAQCGGRSYDACVAEPLREMMVASRTDSD